MSSRCLWWNASDTVTCCYRYGDENVGFMSHMLGGAACDRLIGTGVRMDPTRVLHRAHIAAAGSSVSAANSMQALYGVAAGGQRRNSLSDVAFCLTVDWSRDDSPPGAACLADCSSTDSISSGCGSRHSSKGSLGCRRNSLPVTALGSYQVPGVAAAGAGLDPLDHQASWVDQEAALMMAG